MLSVLKIKIILHNKSYLLQNFKLYSIGSIFYGCFLFKNMYMLSNSFTIKYNFLLIFTDTQNKAISMDVTEIYLNSNCRPPSSSVVITMFAKFLKQIYCLLVSNYRTNKNAQLSTLNFISER